jgi:hypothetical protein
VTVLDVSCLRGGDDERGTDGYCCWAFVRVSPRSVYVPVE